MNKALMKRIFYFVERFFSLALILFAVYVFCYGVISLAIFKQHIFPINYILVLFVTACVISLVLTIILDINKLNFILQAILIYIIVTASVYFVGFYTNCFTYDVSFWIFSLIINLIALGILFGIIYHLLVYLGKALLHLCFSIFIIWYLTNIL